MKLVLACLICLFAFAFSGTAHAQTFQGAHTLGKDKLGIGAYAYEMTDPSDFEVVAQMQYGVMREMDIEGQIGAGGDETYWGIFGKYYITGNGVLDFSMRAGVQSFGTTFINLSPILGAKLKKVYLYLSPEILIPTESGAKTATSLIPGAYVYLQKQLALYFEGKIELSHSRNAFGGGVKYIF
jgi:hypothetical protein